MTRLGLETQGRLGTDLGLPGRDRGAGIELPATDLRRGDVHFHAGLGCLMVYTGTAWRQVHTASAADAAARTAISTTYAALLYVGFRVQQADTRNEWEWTGSAWAVASIAGLPVAFLRQTVAQTGLASFADLTFGVADTDTHGGWASGTPGRWTVPAGQGGTYALEGAAVLSVASGSGVSSRFLKNGAVILGGAGGLSTAGVSGCTIGTGRKLVTLAAGEYITYQAWSNAASWGTSVGGEYATTVSIERIR